MLNTLLSSSAVTADHEATTAPTLVERLKTLFTRARVDQRNDDVAEYIDAHGGVLTDQLERDISRRFGGMAGR